MKNFQINTNSLNTAFSLMEMMVVLLIIAIIAAATAPMVSKKMMRNTGTDDSPWLFTDVNGSIAYNMGGNDDIRVIIGANKYTPGEGEPKNPRLVLSDGGSTDTPPLVFATGQRGKYVGQFDMKENTVTMNGGSGNVGNYSVAMGMGQTHDKDERNSTVAIGYGVSAYPESSIVIGHGAEATKYVANASGIVSGYANSSIVIGKDAYAASINSIAIGSKDSNDNSATPTHVTQADSIAIGSGAIVQVSKPYPRAEKSIAIGYNALVDRLDNLSATNAVDVDSVAIGASAQVTNNNSVLIGSGNNGWKDVIQLGNENHSVYIPGNLVVMGNVLLGGNGKSRVYVNLSDGSGSGIARLGSSDNNVKSMGPKDNQVTASDESIGDKVLNDGDGVQFWPFDDGNGEDETPDNNHDGIGGGDGGNTHSEYNEDGQENMDEGKNHNLIDFSSDARLKNIGKRYEAGLAELKKLDFYHYTFKNDKANTPHVGVIAQDLQKVFPDAVTTDIYGYLRIRWDEMFYAVLNAVKELDTRITALAEQVKVNFDKKAALEVTIQKQQKTIEELKTQNAQLEKHLEKLEKKAKKEDK